MMWDGVERRKQTIAGQQEVLIELKLLSTDMKKVVQFIEGNSNPERGAIVRLDRLEQQGESRQRHITWLWAAMGGGVIKMVVEWFKKS